MKLPFLTSRFKALALAMALIPAPVGAAVLTQIVTAGEMGGNYPFFSETTPNGTTTITTTHHHENNPANSSAATLDGQGVATFSELRSRVFMDGPGALNGSSTASFEDIWTVSHPALTGTQGTMQLGFALSGLTTVLDTGGGTVTDDSFASIALRVDIGTTPANVLNFSSSLGSGATSFSGVTGSPTVTVPFTFTYGTPFDIRVDLRTFGDPDNHFLFFNSMTGISYYGGGTIGEIAVDFLNTATLTTIAIDGADAFTDLEAASLTDHSSIISPQIVPEPSGLILVFLGGSLALLRERRRVAG
jgi:hypothetical protein